MKSIFPRRQTFLVISLIGCCILTFNQCLLTGNHKPILHPNGQAYAGSEACRTCHQAIYDSFIRTDHYLTSRIAEKKYIKGNFTPDHNSFAFTSHMKVVMTEKGGDLFQTAWIDEKEQQTERFDIVMGSGKKGQTYLYWKGKQLYQLPISYFTNADDWANSPGFSPDNISFERNIQVRCMECHTTFTQQLASKEYDPDRIIYGVDCERCHGPGAKHVEFQSQQTALSRPSQQTVPSQQAPLHHIINPAALNRQQSLDACALCHSGTLRSLTPAFSFLPGDTLDNYFVRNSSHIDSFNLDVHANQYGLLTASKCFRISGTMTCSTCHNPHEKEKGDLTAYAQKCGSCHSQAAAPGQPSSSSPPDSHTAPACRLQPPTGFSMTANCINCHMPVKPSHNLTLLVPGGTKPSPEQVRSHLIAIYPAVTEEWLQKSIKKSAKKTAAGKPDLIQIH